ncbi:dihydrofolate reductase, partial [Candidatus Parcubacteria bacterium]|nr:dihydrofolate reductase [Candidatus Parcubacteria bacterium]
PLPNRINIVVTSHDFFVPGGAVLGSLERAILFGKRKAVERVCLIGGERIYREGLAMADMVYATLVTAPKARADAFFPLEGLARFAKVPESEEPHLEHVPPFRYMTFKRSAAA